MYRTAMRAGCRLGHSLWCDGLCPQERGFVTLSSLFDVIKLIFELQNSSVQLLQWCDRL